MNLYMYTHTHKIVVQDEVRIVKAKQQWHDPRGINSNSRMETTGLLRFPE